MRAPLQHAVLLLTWIAPLALAHSAAGQALGPAHARGCAPAASVVVRSTQASYPAVRRAAHAPVWVPGHTLEVTRRVWSPGRTCREWIPPLYATRYDPCGRPRQVCVRPGRWHTLHEPGRFETRLERVWVPGRWEQPPR
jgi:hypothetical protein